jgi:hypothetical protein
VFAAPTLLVVDSAETPPSPRKRYATDEKPRPHTRQNDSADTQNGLRRDSAKTPPTVEKDSAETPPLMREPVPDSGPVPERRIYSSNPDSGTGIRSGTGVPALTTVERLVAEDMDRAKAVERVAEKGERRWQEALEALKYARLGKKPPAPGKGAGWLFDFVYNERPLPKQMILDREKAARADMQTPATLLELASGGQRGAEGLSGITENLHAEADNLEARKREIAEVRAKVRAAGGKET